MTLLLDERYETGPDGAAITTANTTFTAEGGTSTDGSKLFQSGAHEGSLCGRYTVGTVSGSMWTRFDAPSTKSLVYWRMYVRLVSVFPGNNRGIAYWRNSGGTVRARVEVNNDGSFTMKNGTTVVDSSTVTTATDAWCRLEWGLDSSSGQTLRIFVGANVDGTTPDETLTGAFSSTDGVQMLFGWAGALSNRSIDVDAVALDDAAWIGPVSASTPASGSASGTLTLAGTATGKRVTAGLAAGTLLLAGAALGATVHQGDASGTVLRAGTATGQTAHQGTAAGGYTLAGTATGQTPTVAGAQGSATGTLTLAGTATGQAPVVGAASGSAAGTYTLAGTAHGSTTTSGTATGGILRSGVATGQAPSLSGASGSAVGTLTLTGTATGTTSHAGAATGTIGYDGAAQGITSRSGAAVGTYTLDGVATGTAGDLGVPVQDPVLTLDPVASVLTLDVPDSVLTLDPVDSTLTLT